MRFGINRSAADLEYARFDGSQSCTGSKGRPVLDLAVSSVSSLPREVDMSYLKPQWCGDWQQKQVSGTRVREQIALGIATITLAENMSSPFGVFDIAPLVYFLPNF